VSSLILTVLSQRLLMLNNGWSKTSNNVWKTSTIATYSWQL